MSIAAAPVDAFSRQLEGTGDGPTEAQLRRFASIAVVEERLRRALGSAQAHRLGIPAASPERLAAEVQQGELQ